MLRPVHAPAAPGHYTSALSPSEQSSWHARSPRNFTMARPTLASSFTLLLSWAVEACIVIFKCHSTGLDGRTTLHVCLGTYLHSNMVRGRVRLQQDLYHVGVAIVSCINQSSLTPTVLEFPPFCPWVNRRL